MWLRRNTARVRKLVGVVRVRSWRRALLQHRVAASVEHASTPLPPDLRTILDVGANRGQFTLWARHRWPKASIVCFEPLPDAAWSLERLFASDTAVQVMQTALGAKAGDRDLHIARANDSSSLLPPTNQQTTNFPGTEEIGTLAVPVVRLDALIKVASLVRPVLLKLDVQGTELDVLRGATDILHAVDVILAECSWVEFYSGQALADEVVAFLHGEGFRMRNLVSLSLATSGEALQGDIVFVRAPAPAEQPEFHSL